MYVSTYNLYKGYAAPRQIIKIRLNVSIPIQPTGSPLNRAELLPAEGQSEREREHPSPTRASDQQKAAASQKAITYVAFAQAVACAFARTNRKRPTHTAHSTHNTHTRTQRDTMKRVGRLVATTARRQHDINDARGRHFV